MTKWIKVINGVVDSISLQQPNQNQIGDYIEGPDDVFAGHSYNGTAFTPPAKLVGKQSVTMERDRRIQRGFPFNGKNFDFDSNSKANIAGAAQMAFMAIVAGAPAGYYLWHGGASPFQWIAQDNSLVQMDAMTVVEFGKTAAAWEQSHIFAARMLKDMDIIPLTYTDNIYWP